MNYQKIYSQLIQKRTISEKLSKAAGYCELHHIVPVCMNGSNDTSNLVLLTAKEHYFAHLLLHKIYPDNDGLLYAVMMMQVQSLKYHNRISKYTSRLYSLLKKKAAKLKSVRNAGKNNPAYGKIWIVNFKQKKNKQWNKDKPLPNGWIKGRCFDFDKFELREKENAAKQLQKQQKQKELQWLYENFMKFGYEWLHANCKYSDQYFIRLCKKHISGFKTQRGKTRNAAIAKLD